MMIFKMINYDDVAAQMSVLAYALVFTTMNSCTTYVTVAHRFAKVFHSYYDDEIKLHLCSFFYKLSVEDIPSLL